MSLFALVVEGSHDASFLGQLLKARGFEAINKLSGVPVEWRPLFPRQFPLDGENLDRIMRFPEVFVRGDISVGVITAGSDSQLIKTLRLVIDAIGGDQISGVAVFIDIDSHDAKIRFQSVVRRMSAMNDAAAKEGQPGYPIVVPAAPGVMEPGSPAVGVYLFPDNATPGCLEDLLMECAHANHPEVASAGAALVADIDAKCPPGQSDLRALRSGMGRKKAIVGTIANLLRPGASVASSLSQTRWLADEALSVSSVKATDEFLGKMLKL
jgi:hypothetical protein